MNEFVHGKSMDIARPRARVHLRQWMPQFRGGVVGAPQPARELHPVPSVARGSRVSILSGPAVRRLDEWAPAFAHHYKDHRYYEIVEDTLHPEFGYSYFVLSDEGGRVIAIQPFFVLDQDLLAGATGAVRALVERIRRRWPKFLSMRTLMLGCVAGEGHLSSRASFADPAMARLLGEAALEEARRIKAGLIVFKEFAADYRAQLRHLKADGYLRLSSLPMSSVSIDYKDFDDYMAQALSRATRKDLRRKFKAAQAAKLEMTVLEDISPIVDEIYPLYLQVYNRSKLHFEKLSKEYLCELGRRMPDRVRYFVWRKEGRAVAFNLCIVHGDSIYDQYIGLDYSIALDLHLYHYTFRDIVEWAIAQGYKWYRSNGLNYDPKLHLRMKLDPLDLYVRHRWPVANAVMKLVLPWLEPTRYDKHLKRFPNYRELRGEHEM